MSYKWWVVVAAALFIISIVAGLLTPNNNDLADKLSDSFKGLLGNLAPFTPAMAVFIFFKNVLAVFLSFALSPLLCFMPLVTLVVNGWLIGFVTAAVSQKISVWYVLAGVLPHGIFELPAIIMAQAAAFSFGTAVMLAVVFKSKRSGLGANLVQNLKILAIACALLIPAAIIETYVTPGLLGA